MGNWVFVSDHKNVVGIIPAQRRGQKVRKGLFRCNLGKKYIWGQMLSIE